MLHKEIKSDVQSKWVAIKIAKDLKEEAEFFGGYEVRTEQSEAYTEVFFHSSEDTACKILTSSVLSHVFDVIRYYEMEYNGISWYVDMTKEIDGRTKPAIVITVSYKK